MAVQQQWSEKELRSRFQWIQELVGVAGGPVLNFYCDYKLSKTETLSILKSGKYAYLYIYLYLLFIPFHLFEPEPEV